MTWRERFVHWSLIQFWGVLLFAVVFSLSHLLSRRLFSNWKDCSLQILFYRPYFRFVVFQLIGNVYSVHCFDKRRLFKFAVFFMFKKNNHNNKFFPISKRASLFHASSLSLFFSFLMFLFPLYFGILSHHCSILFRISKQKKFKELQCICNGNNCKVLSPPDLRVWHKLIYDENDETETINHIRRCLDTICINNSKKNHLLAEYEKQYFFLNSCCFSQFHSFLFFSFLFLFAGELTNSRDVLQYVRF